MQRTTSTPRRLSRRAALAGLAGAALGFPAVIGRAQERKLKFSLSWLAEGQFAYVYAAKPFWHSRGIDIDIARGDGALTTPPVIASGVFDFGISSAPSVILTRTKGINLRALALVDYDAEMALAVLDKSPIRHPKDLAGKTVGMTLSSGDAPFFAPFCIKNGVDPKSVTIQNVDPRVRTQALLQGQVDAITGYAVGMLPATASTGKAVRFLLYSDYGMPIYGNIALLATPKTVEEQPALCQAVTDGLLEGLKLTLLKPEEGEKELRLRTRSRNDVERTRIHPAQHGAGRYSVLSSPDAKLHGLGWSDPKRLAEMEDFVMQYQTDPGTPKPDLGEIFSNRFVGRVRLTEAEWKTVDANTADMTNRLHKAS